MIISTFDLDVQQLMKRANKLSERMGDIGSKQKDYQDAVTKAKAWLKEVEPKVPFTISTSSIYSVTDEDVICFDIPPPPPHRP